MAGNTAFEWFLLICLFIAVGYIIYLERQPKTDAERTRQKVMDERLRETIRRQSEKMDRARRKE